MHTHFAHEHFSALASKSEVKRSARPRCYLSGLQVAFPNLASGQSHGNFPCQQKGQLISGSLAVWLVSRGWNIPFSPGQSTLPSATLGAWQPGHHLPAWLRSRVSARPMQGGGGRQEHTLQMSHVFVSLNHSLFKVYIAPQYCLLLSSTFSSEKAYFTEILLATATQQCLFYPHWSPKQYCGCFFPFAELLFQCTAS